MLAGLAGLSVQDAEVAIPSNQGKSNAKETLRYSQLCRIELLCTERGTQVAVACQRSDIHPEVHCGGLNGFSTSVFRDVYSTSVFRDVYSTSLYAVRLCVIS